ncbi:MAG: hypothetical protein R3C18_21300 [Planctomycetaceae bacterium]
MTSLTMRFPTMNDSQVAVSLSEWETLSPETCEELSGFYLNGSENCRRAVANLNRSRQMRLTELKNGLEIASNSHVGRVRVGDLNITIHPKLKAASLLRLLRYAYGFRRLELFSISTQAVDQCGFEDLLVCQLNAEAQELVSRGLLRGYIPTREQLSSPRGQIDFTKMAQDGGTALASLPCIHYPRIEDTLLNRVLKASLHLASRIASVVDLRRDSQRLASLLDEQITTIRLSGAVLDQATRQMNRLTSVYSSTLSIAKLLLDAQGVVLEGQKSSVAIPGFLFDMNAFFQSLVSRFLRDNLPDHKVRDEHSLKGMMRYTPGFNPLRRKPPTPRPDYVVSRQGKIRAILDAKYRDLWERQLPREMLYQLVVYAISHPAHPKSSIIYPTMNQRARESRIDVTDPIYGKSLGQVCLRPIHLPSIVELISSQTVQGRRDREAYAKRLALGE